MSLPLSANTQVILLLTAPLLSAQGEPSSDLLSPGEYNRLARTLREMQRQPADLIGPDAAEVVGLCSPAFGQTRLGALLGRGFLLGQAVDQWNARAIWVVSRADAAYPRRLKARLKEDAPPVLYGCGDMGLLESGGLAVVGSRHVDDGLLEYADGIGRLAAAAHLTLVSGAARGIDRAAMQGALQTGGMAVGVMADNLGRAALMRDNREALMERRLVLVSPYDPSAGFNVGHAMQRNKLIYALADAALVVTADFEKGGTWAGAVEQLQRLNLVPVFVYGGANAGKGNAALIKLGGQPWPEPQDGAGLEEAIASAVRSAAYESGQQEPLLLAVQEKTAASPYEMRSARTSVSTSAISISRPTGSAAEQLFGAVRAIAAEVLREPLSEAEFAEYLGISRPQAKIWLEQLIEEGVAERLSKPLRYQLATVSARLF